MKKRSLMFVILLTMSLMLAGCFNASTVQEVGNGTMKVQLQIPERFQSGVSEQFISYLPNLATVSVEIQMGSTIQTQTAAIDGKTVDVIFSDITVGTWTINAEILDSDQMPVYGGTSTTTVSSGSITTTPMHLQMLPGDLNVEVTLPTDVSVTSGTVSVMDPRDSMNTQTQSLTMGTTTGTAFFTSLIASTYPVEIELFDNQGMVVASGEMMVDVLPGRVTTVNAYSSSGAELVIDFTWELPPLAPTGLTVSSDGYTVQLNWNANSEMNIDGYMIYRSTINDPSTLNCVTPNVIYETNYLDANLAQDQTYWYWVQAYNSAGYSSPLSDPASVYVGTTPTSGTPKIAVTKLNSMGYSELYVMNLDGTWELNLSNNPTAYDDLESWSPDGTRILFSSEEPGITTRNLFVAYADGSGVYQLTSSTTPIYGAKWSPDGSQIIYYCEDDYYLMNADGTNQRNITNTPGIYENEPQWSPDGTQILYSVDNSLSSELYLMNSDGSNSRQLTYFNQYIRYYDWSPDGTQIVYEIDPTGTWEGFNLHVMDVDGMNDILIDTYQIDFGFPTWSPDGTKILYRAGDQSDNLWDLKVYDVAWGTSTILQNQNFIGCLPQWADNNTILFVGNTGTSTRDEMYKLNVDGSGLTQLTFDDYDDVFFRVSPY